MPNKTIYVKDSDLPLFEQAQEQIGESISSMFAEFLRERVATLTPHERRILELINQIHTSRAALKQDSGLPGFLDAAYAEAEEYAAKAMASLRAGAVKNAKIFFYAANAHFEMASRDAQQAREVGRKIAGMLETALG